MGVVYLAESSTGALAAVKIIRPDMLEVDEFRRRFVREVQLARSVTGPFTARLLDFDLEGSTPFLATEYVAGPTLRRAVELRGRLESDQLLALATGLLDALSAIHAAGVIHRDLTPNNVLLSAVGPKVIDFGVAHAVEATSMTQTGNVMGTLAWMSPEQAQGHRVTAASDMFSWGLLVAYAGTAVPPFGTGGAHAILYRVVHDEPNLTGLDSALFGAVKAALAKDPAQRPTAAQHLQSLLSEFAEAGSDATTVVGKSWALAPELTQLAVIPETPRPQSGRRFPTRMVAAVLAVLIAGGGLGAWVASRDDRTALQAGAPSTTTTTMAPTTTTAAPTTTTAAPSRDDPTSYFTTDGSRPELFPECEGVFRLCMGTPIHRAMAMLGPEEDRYADRGEVTYYWRVGPVSLAVELDRDDGIWSISAGMEEGSPGGRLSLPGGLVLGSSSMGDVEGSLGGPDDVYTWSAENVVFYTLIYRFAEGTMRMEFTYTAEPEGPDDPGGFNASLRRKLVDSFDVMYEAEALDQSGG